MAKASAREIILHNSIVNGDDIAFSQLFDLYSAKVFASLRGLYPLVAKNDKAVIRQAVSDGFLGYYGNPKTFNPELSTLLRFLHVASERDLINALDKEKRRKNGAVYVEIDEKDRNGELRVEDTPHIWMEQNEIEAKVDQELKKIFSNETDLELAKLIQDGERNTITYCKVLRIEHLPFEEQQRIVKRNKDRVKVELKRKWKRP